jgi:hypothetical protein
VDLQLLGATVRNSVTIASPLSIICSPRFKRREDSSCTEDPYLYYHTVSGRCQIYTGKVTLRSLAADRGHNVQKLSYNVPFVLISVTEEDLRNGVKLKGHFCCVKEATKLECLLQGKVLKIGG